jgi:hypothetical protein
MRPEIARFDAAVDRAFDRVRSRRRRCRVPPVERPTTSSVACWRTTALARRRVQFAAQFAVAIGRSLLTNRVVKTIFGRMPP